MHGIEKNSLKGDRLAHLDNESTLKARIQTTNEIPKHFPQSSDILAMYLALFALHLLGSPALAHTGNYNAERDAAATVNPGGPFKPCTSFFTVMRPFGCTITEPAQSTTHLIDCHGCVLSTRTMVNTLFGHGPVCVGGLRTVTATVGHKPATVTACLTIPSPE